ncbi:hypothetical protein J2Z42_001743 [Clostridium algifaecis]|uniref:Uncharacterized protein n=1 Tax=Clostridium algifaecis TaxID=1472040 RepID=A0ABS4KSQ0_9CLOT|nr:hypothetical protein [Clostridium algifaecis]
MILFLTNVLTGKEKVAIINIIMMIEQEERHKLIIETAEKKEMRN